MSEENKSEKKSLEDNSMNCPSSQEELPQDRSSSNGNERNDEETDDNNDNKTMKKEESVPAKTKSTLLNDTRILSSKLSTDKLICKSPKDSPIHSIKMNKKSHNKYSSNESKLKIFTENKIMWILGILQLVFGFLMVLFGVYVIGHRSNLSQLGGGIWGGIIVMATGIAGILVASKQFCPLKVTAEKIANTIFLALCLISLAVSQLIVVITATGLARDVNQSMEFDNQIWQSSENMSAFDKLTVEMSKNHKGIIYNIALIIVASLECIIATIASYKCSREICCCFKQNNEELYQENLNMHRSHALVSSWLMGKHGVSTTMPTPQIYLVAGPPSSLGRGSKISSGLPVPIYAYPSHPMVQQPPVVGYPLIPAPLGPVPSPLMPSLGRNKPIKIQKRYKIKSKLNKSRSQEPTPVNRSRSNSKCKQPKVTEEEITKTYTGLDRTIAEEFIDICEMKHASLCSDTSCNESTCQSPCYSSSTGCQNHSDTNSNEYLVK